MELSEVLIWHVDEFWNILSLLLGAICAGFFCWGCGRG